MYFAVIKREGQIHQKLRYSATLQTRSSQNNVCDNDGAEKMTMGVRSFFKEHDVSVCTRENDAREARAVCSLGSGFGFPASLTPNQSHDTITKRRVV